MSRWPPPPPPPPPAGGPWKRKAGGLHDPCRPGTPSAGGTEVGVVPKAPPSRRDPRSPARPDLRRAPGDERPPDRHRLAINRRRLMANRRRLSANRGWLSANRGAVLQEKAKGKRFVTPTATNVHGDALYFMVKTWAKHKTREAALNNGWRLAAVAVGDWRL